MGRLIPEWHFHAHYFSAPFAISHGNRNFMVGYELLANPQRDITAGERCAEAERDFRSTIIWIEREKDFPGLPTKAR